MIFDVIEYAIEKDTFSLTQLKDELKTSDQDYNFIRHTLTSTKTAALSPNHIVGLAQSAYNEVGNDDYVKNIDKFIPVLYRVH